MDKLYIEKIIRPQFDYLGKAPMIMGVKYVQIFGTGIKMGDFATLITSPDAHIHLTTWISGGYEGKITIGDFCLISALYCFYWKQHVCQSDLARDGSRRQV